MQVIWHLRVCCKFSVDMKRYKEGRHHKSEFDCFEVLLIKCLEAHGQAVKGFSLANIVIGL